MNDNIKISLTIELEGRPYLWIGRSDDKSDNVKKNECILKKHSASRHINLNMEAYEYMVSKKCPDWYKPKQKWYSLSTTERLKLHLARFSQYFNGISFNARILDD